MSFTPVSYLQHAVISPVSSSWMLCASSGQWQIQQSDSGGLKQAEDRRRQQRQSQRTDTNNGQQINAPAYDMVCDGGNSKEVTSRVAPTTSVNALNYVLYHIMGQETA